MSRRDCPRAVVPSAARDLLRQANGPVNPRTRLYAVYILASRSRRLYTGVTGKIVRRIHAHRSGLVRGHTARYGIHRLVYFETTENIAAAIAREKQIKAWSRAKRVALIERENAGWVDLAAPWLGPSPGE